MRLSRRVVLGSATAALFGAATRNARGQGATGRPVPVKPGPSTPTPPVPQPPPRTQTSGQSAPARCTGTVTFGSKKKIQVRLIGPDTDQDHTVTDDNGGYSIKAPRPGSYTLLVVDPNTNTPVADVSRLTGGINQSVSLTIPADAKGFVAQLAQLRAVEAAAAHVVSQRPEVRNAARDGLTSLGRVVAEVRQFVGGLPPEERQFIDEKLRSCEVQLKIAQLS